MTYQIKMDYHLAEFLDSLSISKIRFDRYFSLKFLFLFLSGWSLIAAFLKTAFSCSGVSMLLRETGSH